MHMYLYFHVYLYVYIYIYRERDRDREKEIRTHASASTSMLAQSLGPPPHHGPPHNLTLLSLFLVTWCQSSWAPESGVAQPSSTHLPHITVQPSSTHTCTHSGYLSTREKERERVWERVTETCTHVRIHFPVSLKLGPSPKSRFSLSQHKLAHTQLPSAHKTHREREREGGRERERQQDREAETCTHVRVHVPASSKLGRYPTSRWPSEAAIIE